MTIKTLQDVLDALAAEAERLWGFTYCECPVCEYSVVVATADLAAGHKVACPMCWKDSFKPVAMSGRPALDSDRPEGADARTTPMPSFICEGCGNECLSPIPEEQAVAEFEALHGVKPTERDKVLCDGCFQAKMAGGRRQ